MKKKSKRIITPDEWKWYGNAAHFICGSSCRFHMVTLVAKYIVSTVGQYWPERSVREIHASIHDSQWFSINRVLQGDDFDNAYMKKFGYEEIGYNRTFETMVFIAGKPCMYKSCHCGLPSIDPSEKEFAGFNNAGDATKGHYKLCKKWASKQ